MAIPGAWSDIPKQSIDREAGPSLYAGTFAADATDFNDPLYVVTDEFGDRLQTFGPVPWHYRGDVLPRKGDPCWFQEADDGSFVVVNWTSESDPTRPVYEEALRASIEKHDSLVTGVHGIPALTAGQGMLWNGSGWTATDLATQSELNSTRTPRGTRLPSSPADGDEFLYQVAEGIVWRFVFNAASSSDLKWEFQGGPPLYSSVLTRQTTSSTSYVDLATVGPSLTFPLRGDYDIIVGGYLFGSAVGNNIFMSASFAGAVALDANGINIYTSAVSSGFSHAAHSMRTYIAANLAAGSSAVAKYRVTGGTGSFESRALSVVPRRVI